ncbi:choice-of-anchor L domain-containing protein, partial [Bacteroidota bacterium]
MLIYKEIKISISANSITEKVDQLCKLPLSAQLVIDQTMGPTQLVRDVLIGSGVTASNISFTGDSVRALCSFSNGNTTELGINDGIIMASGLVTDIPNQAIMQAGTGLNMPGDPDLDDLAGVLGTNDAAVLEFDFIPQSDTLSFQYVFASEEYPEFVNQFNDVFAFFISGPNPSGPIYDKENIALVPETNLPVTINNVNNGIDNNGPCINCQYYRNNTGGLYIVYDGMTVVLTAIVSVIPCETYHMKLAIADDLDDAYDSGVFLEANSFSSTGLDISTNFTASSPDYGAVIEGCNDATIVFNLYEEQTSNYPIYIRTLGTATPGVDFPVLPDSIIIPPGQLADSITITPIQDNITEPTQTIILVLDYESACNNESDTIEFLLLDNSISYVGLDSLYCSSDPSDTLQGYPSNGVFSGWGMNGNIFDPSGANTGTNTITYSYYFIDYIPH